MQSSRASEAGADQAPARDADQAPAQDAAPARDFEAELAQLEDRFKRAVADLDNYRKRAGGEIDRRVLESRESLLRDWLAPLDSIERALQIDPDNSGLAAIRDQMAAVLSRQGVTRLGERGERFDPARHEAIGVRETDQAEDQTVLEVARSGYALGDRVLRPAQVVVARHPR